MIPLKLVARSKTRLYTLTLTFIHIGFYNYAVSKAPVSVIIIASLAEGVALTVEGFWLTTRIAYGLPLIQSNRLWFVSLTVRRLQLE